MPNIVVNLLRRLILAVVLICRLFVRVITCQWLKRPQRIGELPSYVTQSNSTIDNSFTTAAVNSDTSWSNWTEQGTANSAAVSEQIEWYRRRRQEELLAAKAAKMKRGHSHGTVNGAASSGGNAAIKENSEPDLFAELQPKVRAPKKLLMRSSAEEAVASRNLFQVQTDSSDAFFPEDETHQATEFGELEERPNQSAWLERERATSWLDDEENVDMDQLDEIEREQRREEREERKAKRQAEHAQQLEEKKRKQQQKGVGQRQLSADEHRINFD